MTLREINLIPDDILFNRNLFRRLSLWALLLIISLASISGFHLYRTNVALAQKLPSTTLESVQGHLSSRIGEITRLQDELKELDKQRSSMEGILRGPSYSRILLKLVDTMNSNTWLSQLAIDRDKGADKSINLRLTGYAVSNEELGNLIERLSNEPIFPAVLLRYAKETAPTRKERNMGERSNLIQFQIDCRVVG